MNKNMNIFNKLRLNLLLVIILFMLNFDVWFTFKTISIV